MNVQEHPYPVILEIFNNSLQTVDVVNVINSLNNSCFSKIETKNLLNCEY